MTDESFAALLGTSPTAYAAEGWSMGQLRADLRERGAATAALWGDTIEQVADECAAHLERLGLPMCIHPSASLRVWWAPSDKAPDRVLCVTCEACGDDVAQLSWRRVRKPPP